MLIYKKNEYKMKAYKGLENELLMMIDKIVPDGY